MRPRDRFRSPRGAASSIALLGLALLAGPRPARAADAPPSQERNECLNCHEQLDEFRLVKPTRGIDRDVHTQRGLSCAACHGGDPNDPDISGMDPAKGFRGKPTRAGTAEFCARCHADAVFMKRYNPRPYIFSMAEFRTSVHAQRLAQGDPRAATCTSCHGVHGILSVHDPASPVFKKNVPTTCSGCHNPVYMKGYAIPTDQYAKWKESVHGKALLEKDDMTAPVCNDCHGNHGAAPPGLEQVSHVCGTCHGREAELFDKSPVRAAMENQKRGACIACHSNHDVQPPTDAMLATGPGGLCSQCHAPGSVAERSAREIVNRFAGLEGRMDEADSLLQLAEVRGMETELGRQALREAKDQRVTVRAVLHSFDTKQIDAVLTQVETDAGRGADLGRKALRDWRNRRLGMVVSLGVILVIIALLLLRIRGMERPES